MVWMRQILWGTAVALLLLGCGQGSGPVETVPDLEPTITAPTSTLEPSATTTAAPTHTPTPTATATTAPSPTPDPDLAAWTILVYMAGDNDLAAAGWDNLNQMEAAGISDDVQIVVQADLPTADGTTRATRYLITADDQPQTINSPVIGELGDINMGEAETLSNFIAWGRNTYPAQRVGLVMWNHGIGWSGVAFDDGASDQLTMPEMIEALDTGLAGSSLAFVGFDACLMGQLDVYNALAPYAETAVASEELTPAQGWPYTRWLGELYEKPHVGGQTIAQSLVDQFVTLYEEELENDFVTLSAVDLSKIEPLEAALADLATAMRSDLPFTASAIGNARSGAESFAQAYGVSADSYSAIDLHHFSQILAERALDETVAQHATALQLAIEDAVIESRHGRGLSEANGIALYFPRNGRFYDANYAQNGTLPEWNRFLEAYHAHGDGMLTVPQVDILPTTPEEAVSLQNPAHMSFQIVGRNLAQVALFGGWYELDGAGTLSGRRLLLEYDPLIPEPTYLRDGSRVYTWRDGLHEDFYIWSTRVTYLTDGENGQFVVMWPSGSEDEASPRRMIQGGYTKAGETAMIPAYLVFDQTTGSLVAAWATPAESTAPFELDLQAGDLFHPNIIYIAEDGSLSTEAGQPLVLDEAGQLRYEWRPLPSGNYFVGIEAENIAGGKRQATTDFTVANQTAEATEDDTNDSVPLELRGYLDPYLGFQFLYPTDWYRPTYQESALYTSNKSGDTRLQITIYENIAGATATTLKQETVALFGGVNLLYEDQIVIDERLGELTAYGYVASDGTERTGQFVTLVRDGVGYVIDIDGPTAVENETLATITALLDSWHYRPVGDGLFPNRWASIQLVDFSVLQPADFRYQPAEGGWERFIAQEDAKTFVALRVDPSDGLPLTDVVAKWSDIASKGVSDYEGSEIGRFALADQLWWRQDFSYKTAEGEEIWGFLLVSEQNDQQIVSWAEAPAAVYSDLEQTIFQVMLAELVRPAQNR